MRVLRSLFFVAAFVSLADSTAAADKPGAKPGEPAQVSYSRDVRRIFQQNCQGCHQPARAQGSFIMTSYASLLDKGDSGEPGIVPGKPEASKIIAQITPHNGKRPAMPKGKEPLTDHEVNVIKRWIAQGARDDTPRIAQQVIDGEHPPSYVLPPVITSLDFSP